MINTPSTYKYDTNRLMVIDWSSIAHQNIHSIQAAEKAGDDYGIQTKEDELRLWRNKMVTSMNDLIQRFNPLDIIIAVDDKSWRKDFVKEYYGKHTIVYYDETYLYTETENYAYRIGKPDKTKEEYTVDRIAVKDYKTFRDKPHKLLNELSPAKQETLWNLYEISKKSKNESKTPIIPSYKGKRKYSEWTAITPKAEWQAYKDKFALDLAKYYRAVAIQVSGAEGDDVIYGAVMSLQDKYSSIVVVTRDSDMMQIECKKAVFYDHLNGNFLSCESPSDYLIAKIVSGDSSDNIHGMCLPNPKAPGFPKATCVGKDGAPKFVKECGDVYETAKRDGWLDQFMRNKTLIDLSCSPVELKTAITEACSRVGTSELAPAEAMENIGITKHQIDFIKNLRGRGFYSFNPRSDIENCNRLFESDRNAQSAKIDRIQEDLTSPISAVPVSTLVGNQAQPVPDFNVGNAFASPFGDDPPF
jgi:hypothetical protein